MNLWVQSKLGLFAGILALATAAPSAALAQQGYPDKPIRLVTPFPPGGAADTLARALAKSLSEAHGATVVVENRAGAGGTIGTASVAKAAPDGLRCCWATSPRWRPRPACTPSSPMIR